MMIMVDRDEFLQLFTAGAGGGLAAQVLIFRLNPEIPQDMGTLLRAAVAWSLWGGALVLAVGVAGLVAFRLLGGRRRRLWLLPWVAEIVFLGAAALARINVDINRAFLTGSAHRVLQQDAVVWFGLFLLIAVADRLGAQRRARWRVAAIVLLVLAVPLVRLFFGEVVSAPARPVSTGTLGVPRRGLVVIGVEGLDLNLLL
ncbi:MAG TPA: hypothetical protein ENK19_11800, partial [Acidobacteria bacterium]|nr:hypothetical protein [Acidobacteriota bacterium]